MKVEQRGFGITEISERVAGIDSQDGDTRVVFVDPVGDEAFSPWLRPEDVKALIEALTAAYGLMAGDTPTPALVADEIPGAIRDDQGDRWIQIGNTDRYAVEGDGRTLDWIRRNYGLGD